MAKTQVSNEKNQPQLRDLIRSRMHELNMTQNQLAELVGCAQTDISTMLSGTRPLSPSFYLLIASALKMRIDLGALQVQKDK